MRQVVEPVCELLQFPQRPGRRQISRVNEHVAYLYAPLHPAILRLVQSVVDSGRQHGVASGTERARAMEGFLSRGPSPALEPWAQALCQLAQCGHNLRNALFYKMNVTFFQNVHYP